MNTHNLIDVYIQSVLRSEMLPSDKCDCNPFSSEVTFTGHLTEAQANNAACQLFAGEQMVISDFIRATNKGASFSIIKVNGVMKVAQAKCGRQLKPSEKSARKRFTQALTIHLNHLCERLTNEVKQIRESGIDKAINTADLEELQRLVKDIQAAFVKQAA